MQSMKHKYLALGILVTLTVAVLAWMGLTDYSVAFPELFVTDNDETAIPFVAEQNSNESILFSETDYFYEEPVSLTLSAKDAEVVEIYYTLDATPPDSDKGMLYENPLELTGTSSDKQESYVVKACGKKEDGSFTDVYTHSYFIGNQIDERFDVLVFSLSTDPYNLYDYDYGIFVPGRLRDEYIAETGKQNPKHNAPANFHMQGRESERPVYVELLDREGNLIFAQNAGMRAFGGYSRSMQQKSIKLYARKEYNNSKFFDYDFFPNARSLSGLSMSRPRRIVLRNNSNDNQLAFLRDESIQSMVELTYLQDVQHSRPAAIFLNGEYYGFTWVRQLYNEQYFNDMNGIEHGEWAILEGSERKKNKDEDDPLNVIAIKDYDKMYAYSKKDLTDDKTFDKLCQLIDIENFLTYYAVQIYIANWDWPRTNYKVYKNFGDPTLSEYENNTADGKWRWLLYDTDYGLGGFRRTEASLTSLGDVLGKTTEKKKMESPLLIAVLERQDMREKFISIMCDLMNFQFSPENIVLNVREKEAERIQELSYNFALGGVQLQDVEESMETVSEEIEYIFQFGAARPDEMKKQIVEYLGVDESGFTIEVKKNDIADIKVNSCQLDEKAPEFNGFYFDINAVTVAAFIEIGYEFSHWLVNGERVYEEILLLTADTAQEGNIIVELVTEKSDNSAAVPVATLIDYEGDMDYLQIANPYSCDINLGEYYISDDSSDIYKHPLPDYILKAGETLNIYCKNYTTMEAFGRFSLGFNLKNGDNLSIAHNNGSVIESIYLPALSEDYFLVKNMRTGKFHAATNE